MTVVLNHAVGIKTDARPAFRLFFQASPNVHAGAVVPDEEWLVGFDGAVDEVHRRVVELLVHGLHPLPRKRARVLDTTVGIGVDHSAGPVILPEIRVFVGIRVIRNLLDRF